MELSHLLFNLTDQSLTITLLLISDCLINVCFLQMWCWSHSNGSALVRMASLTDPLQQKKTEQK